MDDLVRLIEEGRDADFAAAVREHPHIVTHCDDFGRDLLDCAIDHCNSAAVDTILETAAVDVQQSPAHGTPRMIRVIQSGCHALLPKLLEAGASIEAADSLGLRPIHWAVRMGEVSVVTDLLQRGAEPSARDDDGEWSPLHWAAAIGHKEISSALLQHGADPNARDADGLLPEDIAHQASFDDIGKLLLEARRRTDACL